MSENTENNIEQKESDILKQGIVAQRAKTISTIFGLYDKLPYLLEECKKENLTEAETVSEIGGLLDEVLQKHDSVQTSITIQLLSTLKKEQEDSRIIVP